MTSTNDYSRRHIAELVAAPVHPAFCFGRKASHLNLSLSENFTTAFFAQLTTEEHSKLSVFAEKESISGELLVNFVIQDMNGKQNPPSSDQMMGNFDFSAYSWDIRKLAITEDELRKVPQAQCLIVLAPKAK